MDAVQAPIVAVVGALSGRRRAPSRSARASCTTARRPQRSTPSVPALGAAGDPRIPAGRRPARRCAIGSRQAGRRERHRRWPRGSRVMVTAGANMAFMHAVLATTSPGDEVILPVPFYFNHEMAIEMAGCRAVRVPTDDRYQLRVDAIAARDHRPHARDRHDLAEQSRAARSSASASLRAVNALCRERGHLPLLRRALRVLHLRRRPRTSRRARSPDAAGAHHLAVLAVEGVRVRRLAHRLHGVSRAPRRGDDEEPGHDPHLPDRRVAAGRGGRARRRPRRTASPTSASSPRSARSSSRSLAALAPLAHVPAADGAFYCLLRVCDRARLRWRSPSG